MRATKKVMDLLMGDDSGFSNDCRSEEPMTREECAQAFTQLFHFGDGEYQYINTFKRSTDPTEVEAYSIYWHAAMYSGYGGLQQFFNKIEKIEEKYLLTVPFIPVGAICPMCHFSNDISDKFQSHAMRLAMTYCEDNDIEFTNENHATVNMDLIFKSIRNGELGDGFTYECSACDFELEYKSLTQEEVDYIPIVPKGALDTCIIPYDGATVAELEEAFCWEDSVSFILLNNHYQMTIQ